MRSCQNCNSSPNVMGECLFSTAVFLPSRGVPKSPSVLSMLRRDGCPPLLNGMSSLKAESSQRRSRKRNTDSRSACNTSRSRSRLEEIHSYSGNRSTKKTEENTNQYI